MDGFTFAAEFSIMFLLTFKNVLAMRRSIRRMGALAVVLMIGVANVCAQGYKAKDKDLHGTWMWIAVQYDGENKRDCGKAIGFTSFKYYGADGEYCCAIITRKTNGDIVVSPHEYGKYTFKDGWYSEMGRKKTQTGVVLTDKNHFYGHWLNETDYWERVEVPEATLKYIVNLCKMRKMPADVKKSIEEAVFK